MNILESFRITHPVKLAAVGAGGKSTFLFALAGEISGKCIITTTTHISIEQSHRGDLRLLADDPELVAKIISAPDDANIVIVGNDEGRERVNGPDHAVFAQLNLLCDQHDISILVEADGSRKLPLKAFADHEPVVPEWVEIVVHVIGWNAIGKTVNNDSIFRVDRYCELSGQQIGDIIDFQAVTKMLLHDDGGRKAINNHKRSIVFFNQCPLNLVIDEALKTEISDLLNFHQSIIFGNTFSGSDIRGEIIACFENIAAVVLAAGGSSRLGENNIKQLLRYKGRSFLQNTVDLILQGQFSKTYVVLGCEYEKVKNELEGYPVEIIHNRQWENGQSTSVIAAVKELVKNHHLCGAMFSPVDQPYLDIETINQIVRCHTKNSGKAIVPKFNNIIGSPVLFDRNQFHELLDLKGDKGGRSILHQVPKQVCDITNPMALHDIDTPDAYAKLIGNTH